MSQQHFVTLQEARRVNAIKHNRPRELNHAEQILLAGIELSKKGKYDIEELKTLCKLMLDTTGGERLADKLKDAVNDPVAMKSLIEVYPQVEFYDAINGGVDTLNPFERLHYDNWSMSALVGMANVISLLHQILVNFPQGVETFIYTPWTSLHALRAEWEGDKKQTKYLGYVTPLLHQKALKELMLEPRYNGSTFGTIISAGLLRNKDLWRRANRTVPVSDFDLAFYEDRKFSTNGYILVATNKKTATKLYFCV
jgi:hypothetical protein